MGSDRGAAARRSGAPRLSALALVVASGLACDIYPTEKLPRADSLRPEDVVKIERVGDTSALAISRGNVATLVARIPGASNSSMVTFTTSAGFFVITGTREVRVRATADSTDPLGRLAARITLRPDSSAYAIVAAVIADYRDTIRVAFTR